MEILTFFRTSFRVMSEAFTGDITASQNQNFYKSFTIILAKCVAVLLKDTFQCVKDHVRIVKIIFMIHEYAYCLSA